MHNDRDSEWVQVIMEIMINSDSIVNDLLNGAHWKQRVRIGQHAIVVRLFGHLVRHTKIPLDLWKNVYRNMKCAAHNVHFLLQKYSDSVSISMQYKECYCIRISRIEFKSVSSTFMKSTANTRSSFLPLLLVICKRFVQFECDYFHRNRRCVSKCRKFEWNQYAK